MEKAWKCRFPKKGGCHETVPVEGKFRGLRTTGQLSSHTKSLPYPCPSCTWHHTRPAQGRTVVEIHPNSSPICIPYGRGIWDRSSKELGVRRPCKIGLHCLLAVRIWASHPSRPHSSLLENKDDNDNKSKCLLQFTVQKHDLYVSYCGVGERTQD